MMKPDGFLYSGKPEPIDEGGYLIPASFMKIENGIFYRICRKIGCLLGMTLLTNMGVRRIKTIDYLIGKEKIPFNEVTVRLNPSPPRIPLR